MIDIHKLSGRMGNEMFRDAYIYAQMRDGIIPDVYVQDHRYFDKYKIELQQRYGEGIGILPYTAIHLRVGSNPIDPNEPKYSENPFYVNLSKTGYYIKALEHFPHGKFIVFSDDMEFAKTYFEGDRFAFDDSATDLEAFNKFASCDGHIIANSSWSWWGAYLSTNSRKVLFPNLWFSDTIKRVTFPEEWTEIQV